MSAIQRWDMFAEVGINEPVKYGMWEAVKGRYVTYADHVAAVAAAEQRGYVRGVAQVENERFTDGVKAARDAVEAIPTSAFDIGIVSKDDALAAIDALKGEQA